MADFSLALNEDQLQIQKWVHDFAEDVIRPAAQEWDEREETPWPIIEEAAKIGLYSFDFVANAYDIQLTPLLVVTDRRRRAVHVGQDPMYELETLRQFVGERLAAEPE